MTTHSISFRGTARSASLILAIAAASVAGTQMAEAAETFTVTYRCEKWKTVEFEDAKKAKTHYETVKKLGCEAKQAGHAGHIDVSYRCPKWKRMTLKDHDSVHRWEKWLKAVGFETKHTH